MIKFQKLEQLIDLSKIVDDFYTRLSSDLIIKKLNALKTGQSVVYKQFIDYLISDLELIVISEPRDLLKKANFIKTSGWQALIDKNKKFRDDILKAFGYSTSFRKNVKDGVELSKVLGVKSCPYCDSQYTLSIYSKSKEKLFYQFDHFFPKSIYPYFSVSFFNLIPSCASCNQGKSSAQIINLNDYYHPYVNDLHSKTRFELNMTELDVMTNYTVLEEVERLAKIQFVSRNKNDDQLVKNHNKYFHLNELYENHIDEAAEIYLKARTESKAYQKGSLAIKSLFESEEDAYRFIVGSYLNEKEFHKRPLSKMKFDIAKQLGLIK